MIRLRLLRRHDICHSCDHCIRCTCDALPRDTTVNERNAIVDCELYRPFKSFWLSFACFLILVLLLAVDFPAMSWWGVALRVTGIAASVWGLVHLYPYPCKK